jgi:hypothetical protein
MAARLQRGHGCGASPSKPSIRVARSHSPHHGSRAGRCPGGGGSSRGDSRASGPELPPTGTPRCPPGRRDWPGPRERTCTRWRAARRDRWNRREVERPGDRLDTHRPPPGSRTARQPSRPGPGSVCVSSTPVRSRSPATALHGSAQFTDGGDPR